MSDNFPHQMSNSEDELICSRCGLLNPGEDDPCLAIYGSSAEAAHKYVSPAKDMPESKAA